MIRVILPIEELVELQKAGWIDESGNRTTKFLDWLLNAKPGDEGGPPAWAVKKLDNRKGGSA